VPRAWVEAAPNRTTFADALEDLEHDHVRMVGGDAPGDRCSIVVRAVHRDDDLGVVVERLGVRFNVASIRRASFRLE
jgi:hypothetical protein